MMSRHGFEAFSGVVLIALGLASCTSSAGGPENVELSLSAASRSNAFADLGCVRLPTLLGSQSLTRYIIDEQFDIVVFASRSQAELRFETGSRQLANPLLVKREELTNGYSKEVAVRTASGIDYSVSLISECAQ